MDRCLLRNTVDSICTNFGQTGIVKRSCPPDFDYFVPDRRNKSPWLTCVKGYSHGAFSKVNSVLPGNFSHSYGICRCACYYGNMIFKYAFQPLQGVPAAARNSQSAYLPYAFPYAPIRNMRAKGKREEDNVLCSYSRTTQGHRCASTSPIPTFFSIEPTDWITCRSGCLVVPRIVP